VLLFGTEALLQHGDVLLVVLVLLLKGLADDKGTVLVWISWNFVGLSGNGYYIYGQNHIKNILYQRHFAKKRKKI
jgi:hypothetical protein